MLPVIDIFVGSGQAFAASLVSTLIALALVAGLPLRGTGRSTTFAWCLVIAPATVPSILIGYAYSPALLPLVHFPMGQSLTYSLLVALKTVPALTLLFILLPPALTAASRHSHSLAIPSTSRRVTFALAADLPRLTCGFALGFILAFNDFEIAALLGTTAWSVTVFDAHAGGLPISASVRLAFVTLAVQAPVLIVGLIALGRTLRGKKSHQSASQIPSPSIRSTAWSLALIVVAVTAIAPLALVAVESIAGLPAALARLTIGSDIIASLFFAALSTIVTLMAARFFFTRRTTAIVAALPGLTGSLLVGLAILTLFQIPPFTYFATGPIPTILGLALTALPAAILLGYLARSATSSPAAHAASLTNSADLRWRYLTAPFAAVAALVFLWTYFEISIPSLLAPPGMTTAFMRLHNLMHYGRSSALSAMVVLAFLAPILAITVTWLLARLAFFRIPR